VRRLALRPRQGRPKGGGRFLFGPSRAAIPFDTRRAEAGVPGAQQMPAAPALRALLALTRFGNARHRPVMRSVFEAGLARFAGLNVLPQRAFLTA
jgi:hypothetical protein